MSSTKNNNLNTSVEAGIDHDSFARIDTIMDYAGNFQGPVLNNGYTDDLQPTLSGRLPEGDGLTLRVFCNNVVVGYADIGDEGYWTFKPATPLEPGRTYDFQIILLDSAGTELLPSNTYTIHTTELDQDVAPAAPVITEVHDYAGDHQGVVAQGGKTDDSHPDVSGTAGAHDVVTLSVTSPSGMTTVLGSAVADSNGNWDYQLTTAQSITAALGEWTFTATATNAIGTSDSSAGYSVETVATNADVFATPEISYIIDDVGLHTGQVADGGKTDDKQPELHGTGEPGSVVTVTMYGPSTGKTYTLGRITVGNDGTWHYQFTGKQAMQAGHGAENIFHVSSVDTDGHTVTSDAFTVTLTGSNADDNTPPDITPPDAPILTGIYGTAEDGTKDGSGANSGDTLHDATPELEGVAEPGSIVKIYDGSVLIGSTMTGADHRWAFDVSSALAEGKHTFFATATDAAGNTSAHSGNFVLNIDLPDTDTTPPDAPLISGAFVTAEDGSTDGSGATNGGTLHDTTPELAGVAEPGSIVKIYEGSVLIGSTTAGADRFWAFDVSSALAEGKHTFFATATDAAGNTSAHSGNFVVNIDVPDITPPDAPTIVNYYDDAGDSTGYGNNGTTTDDTTPTLYGHADAKSVVKIYDGSTLLGSVTADKNGNWNFTPSERSEGAHVFFATATDAAGNTSGKSAGFGVIIDTSDTTPAVIEHVVDDHGSQTGDIKNGGTTDDKQPHLSGSAEAGSTVSIHQYDPYTGKEYVLGSVVASTDGHWDYQLAGGQVLQFGGESRFWVTTLDNAGNKATSADFTVTLVGENQDDTTAPDAPTIANYYDDFGDSKGFDSNGGTTDDTTPTLNGQAEANSIVKVYEGSTLLGSTTAKADGSWSYTTPVRADGKHDFTATATDAAGNASAHSGHFVINIEAADTTPPDAPTITGYHDDVGDIKGDFKGGSTTDDARPELKGHAEANSTVKVYEGNTLLGSTTAHSDGSWSFTPSSALSDDRHILTATATDAAGNVSDKSDNFAFVVDTHTEMTIAGLEDDAGTMTGLVANGGVTDDTTPVLIGTAEPGSIVYISSTGVFGESYSFSVTAGLDGKWTLSQGYAAGNYGTFSYSAYSVDVAGNHSKTVTFHVEFVAENQDDTSVPGTPTITSAYDNVGDSKGDIKSGDTTDDSTPELKGHADAGSIVTVHEGRILLGSTTAHSDGTWSFTPSARSDGTHTFYVTATNAAGHTSAHSGNFVVNVDTAPVGVSGFEDFEQANHPDHQFTDFTTDSGLKVESAERANLRDDISWYRYGNPGLDPRTNTFIDDEDLGLIKFTLPGIADTVSFFGGGATSANIHAIHAYDANGHEVAVTITMREPTDAEDFEHLVLIDKYTITPVSGQHIASFTAEGFQVIDDVSWASANAQHANLQSAMLTSPDAVEHHDI
ncbi:Ig-like domain-containing protein, partial [Rahnella woolbedingensis]